MKRRLIDLYKSLFVRRAFFRLHQRLLNISLWGLGILNSENERWSGEDHFLRHLSRFIEADKSFVVFDVGANVGVYSQRLRALHPRARIFAFEPLPESFAILQRNLGPQGVEVYNLALSDKAGAATIYTRPGETTTHASLYSAVIEDLYHNSPHANPIETTTLDSFVAEHTIDRIGLLKLDTEGSELQILRGAQLLLDEGRIDLIQFEFNEMNVISRVFLRDFIALLPGYTLFRLLPDGLVPIQATPAFLNEIFAFQNIVAVRKGLVGDGLELAAGG
jgi:FkbM family methyltransferase